MRAFLEKRKPSWVVDRRASHREDARLTLGDDRAQRSPSRCLQGSADYATKSVFEGPDRQSWRDRGRLMRTCREMGIETVAVYSDADERAAHVAVSGSCRAHRSAGPAESYLSIGADHRRRAIDWRRGRPPRLRLSFREQRVRGRVRDAGLVFIGPPPDAIDRMGSKIEARRLMERAGVPVVPGEAPADQSDAALEAAVARVGFPALIKPSEGGGGIGMQVVRRQEEASRRNSVGAARSGRRVRRRHALRRTPDRTAPAHRDPDLRRRSRSRRVAVRTRVLAAAASPEDCRGEPVAGGHCRDAEANGRLPRSRPRALRATATRARLSSSSKTRRRARGSTSSR